MAASDNRSKTSHRERTREERAASARSSSSRSFTSDANRSGTGSRSSRASASASSRRSVSSGSANGRKGAKKRSSGKSVSARRAQLRRRIALFAAAVVAVVVIFAVVLHKSSSSSSSSSSETPASTPDWTIYADTSTPSETENNHDRDGDGILDQEDIFESAKAYVATRPKYESRYYQAGYPDDGYGVCTDVIGFALLGAGYNLMELMAEDIEESPESYPEVDVPDKKIDFRRVPNVYVWLSRHFLTLTTDFTETEEWLPGDIVTWDHHIGIISDKKNSNGVPYVIHHAGRTQTVYEEDILEGTSHYTYVRTITGHFRVP